MPRWPSKILERIRKLAAEREVRFTLKARRELADLELHLDEGGCMRRARESECRGFSGANKSGGDWRTDVRIQAPSGPDDSLRQGDRAQNLYRNFFS
jgi:hypothetical protein